MTGHGSASRIECSLVAALAAAALTVTACGGSQPTCPVGDERCACGPAATCDDGLVCAESSSTCEAPRRVWLPPIDAAARSCELLVEDRTDSVVVAARFDASVQGEHIRQAPRTAVTFFAVADRAIGGEAVAIEVIGGASIAVTRGQCFDRLGRPLANGGIELER
jgi:hypothetical protein